MAGPCAEALHRSTITTSLNKAILNVAAPRVSAPIRQHLNLTGQGGES
jgi:hypothetical protein